MYELAAFLGADSGVCGKCRLELGKEDLGFDLISISKSSRSIVD
jgi:hypothetical protein